MNLSYPQLNYKEIKRILLKLGFNEIRQKGSHVFFRHLDGRTTTVPNHGTRDIAKPLLREILKDIEIKINDFMNYL